MKPIWYPLFGLSVLALAFYVACSNWGWWREPYGGQVALWMGLVLGSMVTGLVFGISMGAARFMSDFIGALSEQEWRVCWKASMISLRGSDGVSGSISGGIFMMSGRVGSENYYSYYTTSDDGAFHPHKWRADSDTRVFEEDRKDGEIVQWDTHFKSDWVSWLATPNGRVRMDFHIPQGSLRQSFSIE
jgi:hypothetical protein